jgi:hypothetical protein
VTAFCYSGGRDGYIATVKVDPTVVLLVCIAVAIALVCWLVADAIRVVVG